VSDPNDLVSVYKAGSTAEAHLVLNLLADEGIQASVSEENEPLAGLPIAAPDVLVRHSDEVRARAIVADYQDDLIRRAERPDWTCPKCGATVEGSFDFCDVCGAERPGTSS